MAGKAKPVATTEINLRRLRSRIQERIDALDTNARQVSRKAKLGDTAVSDVLKGKNNNPSVPVIERIAAALQSSVAYLVGETDEQDAKVIEMGGAPAIVVAGIAEAGAFRAMPQFGPDHESDLPRIIAPRSRSYPKARHFALEVRGDSMNAAKPTPIVEGMYVLCVDIISAEIEVESGRIYAVRRTIDGGQTYECTIKRAKVFRERIELHPESTNQSHKVINVPRRLDREEVNEVAAIGWVYGVFNSYEE